MRRRLNKTFEDLVNENIEEILMDKEAIKEIEEKVEERRSMELQEV